MTEEQWMACTDALRMLSTLRGKVCERKIRLFACGCGRLVWEHLSDPRCRVAVETAEQFADLLVDATTLKIAEDAAWEAYHTVWTSFHQIVVGTRGKLRKHVKAALPEVGAVQVAVRAATAKQAAFFVIREYESHIDDEYLAVAIMWAEYAFEERYQERHELIRCIFGNPFSPVRVDPAWLTPTVVQFTQAIYEDRSFERLPILADALEEAGCTDADILAHCRRPGEHVRGCWVVDLLLGKQ
jgi:hypothetical protein